MRPFGGSVCSRRSHEDCFTVGCRHCPGTRRLAGNGNEARRRRHPSQASFRTCFKQISDGCYNLAPAQREEMPSASRLGSTPMGEAHFRTLADPSCVGRFKETGMEGSGDSGEASGREVDKDRLIEELREAVRARDEFVAIAAHELRNPMTPILMHVGRLLANARDPGRCRPDLIAPRVELLERAVQEFIRRSTAAPRRFAHCYWQCSYRARRNRPVAGRAERIGACDRRGPDGAVLCRSGFTGTGRGEMGSARAGADSG